MIELEACVATQSWVNREYKRGLSTQHGGAPVLRISEVEVLFPTLTTWGCPCATGVQTQSFNLNDELGGYYVVEF